MKRFSLNAPVTISFLGDTREVFSKGTLLPISMDKSCFLSEEEKKKFGGNGHHEPIHIKVGERVVGTHFFTHQTHKVKVTIDLTLVGDDVKVPTISMKFKVGEANKEEKSEKKKKKDKSERDTKRLIPTFSSPLQNEEIVTV